MKTKTKIVYSCQACGYQAPKWLGRCPDCGAWNTFVEERFQPPLLNHGEDDITMKSEPVLLKEIENKEDERIRIGIGEIDRVLGGGIVSGSVILIGGDPGIGKSTICLQISNNIAKNKQKVLYVSAEESTHQTKLRADRLGDDIDDNLYIVNQTDLTAIEANILKIKPRLVVIDSIQVIFHPELSSSPGSVAQVRECAGILVQLAKKNNISLIMIGHVTKEGSLAGPRILEHIVDTVLYFEGERYSVYRLIRAVKNRFGSTNEIGVFEMTSLGLQEVNNPSSIFLSGNQQDVSGTATTCVMEGTRPLLVEIQALVTKAGYGYAQRKAQGLDYNRLILLIAVLEKRIGLRLEDKDIFVNVVGGMKIQDPAVDLAVIIAVASAYKEKVISKDTVFLGEIGLGGEVRNITQSGARIKEISKLGFKKCILPENNIIRKDFLSNNIEIIGVNSIKEALSYWKEG